MSRLVLGGYTPNSVVDTVLLDELEHPSTFLAVVVCTVSSCFTNFAFSSRTSPAYSCFGTITFIRKHILILVSRFESVRIASILPTCVLPLRGAWEGVGSVELEECRFVRCCGAKSSGQIRRLSTSTAYDCSLNTHDYLDFAEAAKQPVISALANLSLIHI